jgi:hypothetical protein
MGKAIHRSQPGTGFAMKLFLGILLAAGAAVGFVQQRRIAILRETIDDQKPLLAEAQRLRQESAELNRLQFTSEQVAAMRAERSELMRLRAGLADLRIAAQTPDKVEAEIARLDEAAKRSESDAKLIYARREAEELSKALSSMLQMIGSMARGTARANEGQPVRSFDALKEQLAASGRFPNFEQMWESFMKGHPPHYLSINRFEFLPPEGPFLLRERQPRQLPDGEWTRLYLTTKYKTKTATLTDPAAFPAWEQENAGE